MTVEDRLRATLTERAEGQVDVERLRTGAVTRGRRRQRTRVGGTALVALAVLGAGAAVPLALSNGEPDGFIANGAPTVTPSAAASPTNPPAVSIPMPPPAPNVPTGLTDPSVLGSDPGLLHLSFDTSLPWPADAGDPAMPFTTTWASYRGEEYLDVAGPLVVSFGVGAHADYDTRGLPVIAEPTVAGKPAKLYQREVNQGKNTLMLVWQPFPGVTAMAQIYDGTVADLVDLAARLRFDRVSLCVTEFQLVDVPPGATLDKCNTRFTVDGVDQGTSRAYTKPDGSLFSVNYSSRTPNGRIPSNFPTGTPDVTIGGLPGYWEAGSAPQGAGPDGETLYVYEADGRFLTAFRSGSITRAQTVQAVATLQR